MMDQAAGLRALHPLRPVRVISVTGGKGGVGKSNVSLNLAIARGQLGQSVLLLDGDLGLANVDVLLGLRPVRNLSHVLDGKAALEDVVLVGPAGIRIIPAASGMHRMAALSRAEHAGLIRAFGDLGHGLDTMVIDTPAGLSESVIAFTNASQEIVVTVCDEPASLTDAYALIKVLHRDHGRDRFRIVSNRCPTPGEGQALFHPAGIAARQQIARPLEIHLSQLTARPVGGILHPVESSKEKQILEAGQFVVKEALMGHIADPPPPSLLFPKPDLSVGRLCQLGDHPQKRRLSRAVGSKDDPEIALLDVEVYFPDCRHRPESLGEALD